MKPHWRERTRLREGYEVLSMRATYSPGSSEEVSFAVRKYSSSFLPAMAKSRSAKEGVLVFLKIKHTVAKAQTKKDLKHYLQNW